jgi:chorismate mutase
VRTLQADSKPFKLTVHRHSPDEYPFTSDLPEPVLPPLTYPVILYPNKINVNPSILSLYTSSIVPRVIVGKDDVEDDGNYGSAATLDVEVLQSISKRVHYGTPVFLTLFVFLQRFHSQENSSRNPSL